MTAGARVIGAFLLSAAWGFLDGWFVAPSPAPFWALSAAGFACFVLAGAGSRRSWCDALTIAAIHVAMAGALPVAMAHLHLVPGSGAASAGLLRTAGIDAWAGGDGGLLVRTSGGAKALAVTWEAGALPMAARLAAAFVVVGGAGHAVRHLVLVAVFAWARALVLLLAVTGGAPLWICYHPLATLLTFLPVVAFARDAPGGARAAAGLRAAVVATMIAGAGSAALGFDAGWRDPGVSRGIRVLIDESHSDWEWTTPAFDHRRYGQRSLYGYGLWRAWISRHHSTRVTAMTPTETDLAAANVLIIKTPTTPYDRETIAGIERFVRAGGGLFLIGDHTNLFGMSTVLNELAEPYGIAFANDDTFPLDGGDDIFTPPVFAPHPALRGIREYAFETSCTLEVPWTAEHLIVGRRLGAEPGDYGHPNFFGNIALGPDERFGLFTQAAVVAHGAGRVAAFSDSTNFSNFSFLWPGRRELTLNIIDWIGRKRAAPLPAAAVARGASAILALAGVALACRRGRAARAAACWAAVTCFALAAQAGSFLCAREAMPAGATGAAPPAVVVDTSLSRPGLSRGSPVLSREARPSWIGYNSFFIDLARSGLWPRLGADLSVDLIGAEAVVMINPVRRPDERQGKALRKFLQGGGRLLVIESVTQPGSEAAAIVAPFGIASTSVIAEAVTPGGRFALPAIAPSGGPGGGEDLLAGGVRAAWQRVGRGLVVLAADGALFSDRGYGGVYSTPDDDQLRIHAGQEALIALLMDGPAAGHAEKTNRDSGR